LTAIETKPVLFRERLKTTKEGPAGS
jgi:hypothetical protein